MTLNIKFKHENKVEHKDSETALDLLDCIRSIKWSKDVAQCFDACISSDLRADV